MGWRRREGGGAVAGAASRLRFAPFSNHLLVSSWDSGLRLYEADASELRMEAKSEAALLDCCFQDEAVALTGAQGTIGQHHEVVSCIEFSQITGKEQFIALMMDGQVVTATLDRKLMFWDSQTRNVSPNSIKKLDSDVASLSVCDMYILAAIEREVYIYDMRNLIGPVKVKDSPVEYHLRSLHSSPEWKGYAAGSVDGVVAVKYFDRGTDGDMGYVFRCHPKSRDGRSSMTHWFLIGSDRTFVTGDNEGYVIAWDAQSKKKLHEFPIYSGSVASIAFNHNGQTFAVASNSTYQESDKMVEEHQIFFEMKQHF
uniref:Anaphase-promoting complex subunit 4 WD40 domain-containing protein n=1 Tax=Oryza punctata TaxID=4537 RepID=A0A0E0KJ89_ORYPU